MTSKQVKDFLKNEPSEFLSANCFQPHTLPQHVFAYASKNQHSVIITGFISQPISEIL
jgi:hypothetical protein